MEIEYRIAPTPGAPSERVNCDNLREALDLAKYRNYDSVAIIEPFNLLQLFVRTGGLWRKVDGKCGMDWSDFMSKFGCEVN